MITGIVRRIDELGRVVIPKEIRKTMRIKEGEEMEVCVSDEDTLILKKYSPIKNIKKIGDEYVEVLNKCTGYSCFICNTDEILFSCGDKQYRTGTKISKALEECIKKRKIVFYRKNESIQLVIGAEKEDVIIAPILSCGDAVGAMTAVCVGGSINSTDKYVKILEIGASFFAKQIE